MLLREKQAMTSLITPIARQDHDVDGRVRVEPEQVLEEHRVAAERRVEDAEVRDARSSASMQHRDGDDRRAEDHARGWSRRCAHTNSGSRNQVMPGARIRWIVTMKLRPVRIDDCCSANISRAKPPRRGLKICAWSTADMKLFDPERAVRPHRVG